MDIPSILVDTTTIVANHSVFSHYGCVLLRCMLGMYFILVHDPDIHRKEPWIAFLVASIVFFGYKYAITKSWKVYARTIIFLIVSTILLLLARERCATTVVGMLFIADAMMGVQSRYTATLLM